MLSPETKSLSRQLNDIRIRTDRAKDEIVTLCRTAVLVLADTNKSLADEMKRRLFLLDAENEGFKEIFSAEGNIERLIEMMSDGREGK